MLAYMDTPLISTSELPLNAMTRANGGELLIRMDAANAAYGMRACADDPTFRVHYQDAKTLICEAPDGSVGALAEAEDGNWEARLNVVNEPDRSILIELAAKLRAVQTFKAIMQSTETDGDGEGA